MSQQKGWDMKLMKVENLFYCRVYHLVHRFAPFASKHPLTVMMPMVRNHLLMGR